MLIEKLQNKLHNEIPLTKVMEIKIKEYDEKHLLTLAPLDININDKGTAFGGSLATMTIISSWSMAWLISQELGFNSENIVVIKNEHSYLKPVKGELICKTLKPTKEEIKIIKDKLEKKASASVKITSQIIENDEVCVDFKGIYVIKL